MRTRMMLATVVAMISATPAAALTPAEESLLARVPAAIAPHCAPDTTPPSTRAVAALQCDLPTSVGVIVDYSAYRSYRDLTLAYLGLAIPRTGRRSLNFGSCAGGELPAERVYRRQGIPAGRWACYRTASGSGGLIWTRPEVAVIGWARRPDGNHSALMSWWRAGAGPLGDDNAAVADVGVMYPDPLDRRLLLDIDPDVAAACRRIARPADAPWTNGLRCERPGGGDVTYRRYPDSELAQDDYLRSLGTLRISLRTGGACAGPGATERAYPGGRYACVTDRAGRARLEWIDFARRIRGVARVPGGDQAALRDWWRTQPR